LLRRARNDGFGIMQALLFAIASPVSIRRLLLLRLLQSLTMTWRATV
jgi:hypothetical protein